MMPVWTTERTIIGVAGFVLLLLAESVWPFRQPVESRWCRYLINLFIGGSNALLLSVLLGGAIIAAYRELELQRVGLLHALGVGGWWNIAVTIVCLDGVTYLWHRAYHGVPLMWRMHRVHHSDRDLDVTTSGRFHLMEMALSAVFRLGVIAALGASVAGVVIFEIVFGAANQLEHSNLRIPEPFETWLRAVIVTPDMHRIHHSQETAHTNSNYSTIFSWWDRLFRTYHFGENQRRLTIGLPEYQTSNDVALGKVIAMPFGPPCIAHRAGSALAAVAFVIGIGAAGACQAEPSVGKPAPDFSLTDAAGQSRALSAYKGHFVVLEWFNPDCPFSRKHYVSGNMQVLQREATAAGVVWLSVDSSAPGKQGHMTQDQARAFQQQRGSAATAILLDPDGKGGRLYGAKTTPQMFVINPQGVLIYAGAIDNKPSADPADIPGAVNYVRQALTEARAGKPVSVPQTKSYGCSVKY